jgi:hypothetical protein
LRNFSAILTKLSATNPEWYKVSVFPTGHQGEVPAMDFRNRREFVSALQRMGIEGEDFLRINKQLELGKSVSRRNFVLTPQDASYFGWPSN